MNADPSQNIVSPALLESESPGVQDGLASTKQAQETQEDYMAKTFANLGLNINLLMGSEESKAGVGEANQEQDGIKTTMINTGGGEFGSNTSGKMQSLLDAIPDFTFLSEATVSMGQLFV